MFVLTDQVLLLDCHSTQPRFGAPFAHDCTAAASPAPVNTWLVTPYRFAAVASGVAVASTLSS